MSYMVSVAGGFAPSVKHSTYKLAEREAMRLLSLRENIGKQAIILKVVSTVQSRVAFDIIRDE